jgi:4-hydroxybenzoate polyprenyltransferase
MSLRTLLVRSRPRFWLYLAGPVIVGAVYGAGAPSELLTPLAILLFGYFLLPANLFLYGLNDVFDAEIDRENPKKAGRETRYRGEASTRWAVAISAAIGIALLALLPPGAIPWLVGFLVLGAAYSAPPIRLKTRPLLDSVSNGLYVLPGAAAYVTLAGTQPPVLAILGGWLWTMAMHTFSAIPDIEPDRRAEIRTTATVLGHRYARGYCGLVWALAAGVFALLDIRLGLLFSAYPLLLGGVTLIDLPIGRAYWWYPTVNAGAGMALSLGGLWVLVNG